MSAYQERVLAAIIRSQVTTLTVPGGAIASNAELVSSNVRSQHVITNSIVTAQRVTLQSNITTATGVVRSQHTITKSAVLTKIDSNHTVTDALIGSKMVILEGRLDALQNNVDHALNMPVQVEIPAVAHPIRIFLYNYDGTGHMEDLDTDGAKITIAHQNGSYYLASNLTTSIHDIVMTKDGAKTGVYYYDFYIQSNFTAETAIVEVAATEATVTKYFGKTMVFVSNSGVAGVVQSQHVLTRTKIGSQHTITRSYTQAKVASQHTITKSAVAAKLDSKVVVLQTSVDSRVDITDTLIASKHGTTRSVIQLTVGSQHTITKSYVYDKIVSQHNLTKLAMGSQLTVQDAYIQGKIASQHTITKSYLYAKIVSNAGGNIDSRLDVTDAMITSQHNLLGTMIASQGGLTRSKVGSQHGVTRTKIGSQHIITNGIVQSQGVLVRGTVQSQHVVTKSQVAVLVTSQFNATGTKIGSQHTITKSYVQAKVASQHTITKALITSQIALVEGVAIRKATFTDRPFCGSGTDILSADPSVFETIIGSTASNSYVQLGATITTDTGNTGTKTVDSIFIDGSFKAQVTEVDGAATGSIRFRTGATYGTSVALTDEVPVTTVKAEFNRSGAIKKTAMATMPFYIYAEGKSTSGADVIKLWGLSSTEITVTYTV